MSKVLEAKKAVVTEIADKLKSAATVVVVDYRGLSVSQVTELRKNLREQGIDFKVYKNSMSRRATEAAGLSRIK